MMGNALSLTPAGFHAGVKGCRPSGSFGAGGKLHLAAQPRLPWWTFASISTETSRLSANDPAQAARGRPPEPDRSDLRGGPRFATDGFARPAQTSFARSTASRRNTVRP